MTVHWGILGPGATESTIRARTLELGASTRRFNDLAVPGLGGVWFGKQLFLAITGILVAERAVAHGHHATKISVANAIEALACWLALQYGSGRVDERLRGTTKLAGRTEDELHFGNVSRPSFYVSQPMRMATVAALPALGLVDASGSRFNSFSCNQAGLNFIEAVSRDYRPYNRNLIDHLLLWVLGKDDRVYTQALHIALSPLTPLSHEACVLLRERLYQGTPNSQAWERQRRGDALDWVESRKPGDALIDWNDKPVLIRDDRHWADMRAGACFFAARDAAIAVLNALEAYMGTPENRFSLASTVPERLRDLLATLRAKAQAFLELQHADPDANAFCRHAIQPSDGDVLHHLVGRDGRILRLMGEHVCAGPAFKGDQEQTSESEFEDTPQSGEVSWPEHISYRIPNLWWLSRDLKGELDAWLNPSAEESNHG
jgi:hypothetical protein